MFCGLPVMVATLPMFDAVATAITYGAGVTRSRRASRTDERRHHETDDIVHEKPRQQTAAEYHRRQQVMRLQPLDEALRDPVEEADHPQVADDQHHREQEHDGGEINRSERVAGPDDPKRHHQDGTDDGGTRAIDLHPGKLAEREDEVAADEDQVRGQCSRVGEEFRVEGVHVAEQSMPGADWTGDRGLTVQPARNARSGPACRGRRRGRRSRRERRWPDSQRATLRE